MFWSFCGHTQNLLLLKCDSCPKNTHDVLINQYRSQCLGISADVRRKIAQDYYHFSTPTHVAIVWSFCGRTQNNSACLLAFCASTYNSVFWSFCGHKQNLLLLKCDSCPKNTHDVLINQYRSFCGRTQILQIWMKN